MEHTLKGWTILLLCLALLLPASNALALTQKEIDERRSGEAILLQDQVLLRLGVGMYASETAVQDEDGHFAGYLYLGFEQYGSAWLPADIITMDIHPMTDQAALLDYESLCKAAYAHLSDWAQDGYLTFPEVEDATDGLQPGLRFGQEEDMIAVKSASNGYFYQGVPVYFVYGGDGGVIDHTVALFMHIWSDKKPVVGYDDKYFYAYTLLLRDPYQVSSFLPYFRDGAYEPGNALADWLAFNGADMSVVMSAEDAQEEAADDGQTEAAAIRRVKIRNEGAVNVRQSSSAESEKVGTAQAGKIYQCLSVAENGWFEIRLENGARGFVSPRMATPIQ